jgi:hypothetical protein
VCPRAIIREFYMAEHIVAVFETEAAATAASQSLQSAGIPLSSIRQYAGGGVGQQETEPTEHISTHTSGGGFWAWLFGEDTTAETTRSVYTHDAYDRRASAGNVVLSVTVDEDAKIHQAIAALEAHDPVDIDERSDEVDEDKAAPSIAPLTGASTTGRDFSSGEVAQAGVTNTTLPSGRVGTSGAPIAPTASVPGSTSPAMPDTRLAGTEPKVTAQPTPGYTLH